MTETSTLLLTAAAQVVRRAGSLNLTLEAVAKEAGVSKGGLLYHFPNKEALIAALIAHEMDAGDQELSEQYERHAPQTGRWARAFAAMTLDADASREDAALKTHAGLLAAVALNPDLLEPVRHRYRQWSREAEQDGLEPGLGTLIRLAMDGVWLAELLDLSPPDAEERRVLEALIGRLSTEKLSTEKLGTGSAADADRDRPAAQTFPEAQ